MSALSWLWLKARGEFDAVRWVKVDHLLIAREVFTSGKTGHHLKRVALIVPRFRINGLIILHEFVNEFSDVATDTG